MADSIKDLENQIAALRAEIEKGSNIIREQQSNINYATTLVNDMTMNLVNAKRVGQDGKVGALALSNDLAGAPVGDSTKVRSNLGIGALAMKDKLSDADAGDQSRLRANMGLGALALANDLAGAPVGDAGKLRNNLGLGPAAVLPLVDSGDVSTFRYGPNGVLSEGSGAALREHTDRSVAGVVTSGVTSNGFWTRMSDGTQMCWVKATPEYDSKGHYWTYPLPFKDEWPVAVHVTPVRRKGGLWGSGMFLVDSSDPAYCNVYMYEKTGDQTSSAFNGMNFAITAIGRWK